MGTARSTYLRVLILTLAMLLASLLLFLQYSGTADAAATLPTGFKESVIFSGLNKPTNVQFAQDGRIFVAEKSGIIKVFDNLTDTTPKTFADLRTNVYNFWDHGLLGVALDPNFPTNPYVYVLYSYDADIGGTAPKWGQPDTDSDTCPNPPGATADGCVVSGRLSRLQASGDQMTGSEQVLINDWCAQYPSHSVGDLAFGQDGALYVSGGDGASFNFTDYGQEGNPPNPCGDPPGGVGATLTPPTTEGGRLRSQDLRTSGDPVTLDGTVLRVDPGTGRALPGNPLYSHSDTNAQRIISHGLRNPFRFTTRPGTDEIWVGDVGMGDWEEINRINNPTDSNVENFGWPCYEGAGKQDGFAALNTNICNNLYSANDATAPYYTYHHNAQVVTGETCPTSGGSATAGLAFYPGGSYPSSYNGALFFGDYSRKCIWVMNKGSDGLPDPSNIETFAAGAAGPVDLKIGPGGDLFYVDLNGGTIRRIQYDPNGTTPPGDPQPPVCKTGQFLAEYFNTWPPPSSGTPTFQQCEDSINYDWNAGGPGNGIEADDFSVRWSGTHHFDEGNYVFSTNSDDGIRMWVDEDLVIDDWRDQGADTTKTASRFMTAGDHHVKVEYYEHAGSALARASWQLDTNIGPKATISSPASTLKWAVGDTINFSGSAVDAQGNALPASALSWDLALKHCTTTAQTDCHNHDVQTFEGMASGSFSAPDHEYPAYLVLQLTATDPQGLKNTQRVPLDPKTVALRFQTKPTGLQLAVGPDSVTAPFSRTVIVKSKNTISAPSPQALSGKCYKWNSWSDNGTQSHDIIAPAINTTYTATYSAPKSLKC